MRWVEKELQELYNKLQESCSGVSCNDCVFNKEPGECRISELRGLLEKLIEKKCPKCGQQMHEDEP